MIKLKLNKLEVRIWDKAGQKWELRSEAKRLDSVYQVKARTGVCEGRLALWGEGAERNMGVWTHELAMARQEIMGHSSHQSLIQLTLDMPTGLLAGVSSEVVKT